GRDALADLRGVRGEERRLRARLVVLRLLADALEDVAPGRVVEVATVQPPWLIRQPAHHRLSEPVARVLEGVDLELEAGVALVAEAGEGVRPRHPWELRRLRDLRQPRGGVTATRIAAPTSGSARYAFRGKIVWMLPAPSFFQRGTMCTWTCGIVCPVAS